MAGSLLMLPIRIGVRTARVSLVAGRELADIGLATLAAVERMLGEDSHPEPELREDAEPVDESPPAVSVRDPEPGSIAEPTIDEAELVEEFADPGAEDGAGASLRVAPPFQGYDELRAPDVIARLPVADIAELGETELYERSHRARRTVLDAIAREIGRRGPA